MNLQEAFNTGQDEKASHTESRETECERYLMDLKSSVYDDDENETISAEFIETYKRYIEALRVQYPGSGFLNVIDHIPVLPNLNSHYWRMFFSFTWNALSGDQKQSLFDRFPSMKEYGWLLECDPIKMMGSSTIVPPFIPKAAAVAAMAMRTERFESGRLEKASLIDDLMWIDYNFDLRDYDKVYRDIDGWGITFSTETPRLMQDIHYEFPVERIENPLRFSISLDDHTKRHIILNYTDLTFEQVQGLIEILENEIKSAFMVETAFQTTQIAELVEAKRREWQEILNDYRRE
ncbi:MAG: hypothetical protein PHQ22_09120 [Sulfuricurvum sp.]|nr:hypothetical protein [Sulfuricurvum sp.]